MIRIYSIKQALSLRGTIPELALIRSIQFQGEGYCPIEHGHIIVMEPGDKLSSIPEVGPLHDEEGCPAYELIEAYTENGLVVYEVAFQIDDGRTMALIIPDEPWLDDQLRTTLRKAAPMPMSISSLKRGTS
jgi:hypothetical protein